MALFGSLNLFLRFSVSYEAPLFLRTSTVSHLVNQSMPNLWKEKKKKIKIDLTGEIILIDLLMKLTV